MLLLFFSLSLEKFEFNKSNLLIPATHIPSIQRPRYTCDFFVSPAAQWVKFHSTQNTEKKPADELNVLLEFSRDNPF